MIDGTAPNVRALSASGKTNRQIRLRYRTGDAPSGKTRERIRVTKGGSLIASFSRAMANANFNTVQSLLWTPRSAGSYSFCVQAFDPAGNSRQSCARVGVTAPAPPPSRCDPSYPTVCIPSPPPDLDCGDIRYTDFVVRQPDPHGFDGNNDGVGCES